MKIQVLVDFCICKYLLEVQQELMNITILSLVGTPNTRGIPLILGMSPLKSKIKILDFGVKN